MTDDEFELAEQIIERGKCAFVAVGRALMAIRDRGLDALRRRGYGDFGQYCRDRWGFTRQQGYNLIRAALVIDNLEADASTTVDRPVVGLPANERQARPLTALPPDLQPAAWQLAIQQSTGGTPTSAEVQRAARQVLKGELPVELEFEPESTTLWPFRPGEQGLQRVIATLLHLHTVPDDLVLDCFAGDGTSLDVAATMGRRCAALDLAPSRDDIVQFDALDLGRLPPEALGGQVSLAILDPPPWRPGRDGAPPSSSPGFSAVPLAEFYRRIERLGRDLVPLLDGEAHVALAVGQARVGGEVVDLPFGCVGALGRAGYRLVERIALAYGRPEAWGDARAAEARRGRYLLRGYRDLLIFARGRSA